jgi:hypothetical protein
MILAVFVTALLAAPPSSRVMIQEPDSACLHAAGKETAEQRARSVAALGAARALNTAQAAHAGKNKSYATREELAGYVDGTRYNLAQNAEIVPGFTLTLDTTPKGYWFEIADKTDGCGFRYISNENGLIFVAQPIR